MAERLRFYLDENLPVTIAEQLAARGVEAVTVRDLGLLGYSDEVHLAKATELEYVLCTNDIDFLRMASTGVEHCGIVFGHQTKH